MPRISGVDIPREKQMWIALTYIHGIGRKFAKDILKSVGIEEKTKAKDLTDEEVTRIANHIQEDYIVEGLLRRSNQQNITRLKDISCYRGMRHRRGLPVRGQGTQSNARTRKGPRKTVAGKKK
jgi:small subunit ribosomal protein S13